MILDDSVTPAIHRAIVAGIEETKSHLITDRHGCSGNIDAAIGVYNGSRLVYVLPLNIHASRFCPASLFGDPATASAFYVAASTNDRKSGNVTAFRGGDGKPYMVKNNRHGMPVGNKYTLARWVKSFVSVTVAANLYEVLHVDDVDWSHPRNLHYKVRLVRDLEIS